MPIRSLSPYQFRNLSYQTIEFHPEFNLVIGVNGSGKTSLLESLYTLTSLRSFRTYKLDSIIQRNEQSKYQDCVVRGNVFISKSNTASLAYYGETEIGVKRSRNENTFIKINGERIRNASELASLLPTIIIEPASDSLLNGSPNVRRSFIDWGVFHVEHSFANLWKRYLAVIKQRNALLRSSEVQFNNHHLIEPWDRQASTLGEQIHAKREMHFKRIDDQLKVYLRDLAPGWGEGVNLSYRRGWDKKSSLSEAFGNARDTDLERKYTSVGPHRMDVRISYGAALAVEALSRGQQKVLSIALNLAQVASLQEVEGKEALVLIDDLASELDEKNIEIVLGSLMALNTQVICTSLSESQVLDKLPDQQKYKVFHVEHGLVTPM